MFQYNWISASLRKPEKKPEEFMKENPGENPKEQTSEDRKTHQKGEGLGNWTNFQRCGTVAS